MIHFHTRGCLEHMLCKWPLIFCSCGEFVIVGHPLGQFSRSCGCAANASVCFRMDGTA